jgi:hypothetical protein
MVVERNPVRSASPQIEVEIIRPPFCALISKAINFSLVQPSPRPKPSLAMLKSGPPSLSNYQNYQFYSINTIYVSD